MTLGKVALALKNCPAPAVVSAAEQKESYLLSIAYCCNYFYQYCEKPLSLSPLNVSFGLFLLLKLTFQHRVE